VEILAEFANNNKETRTIMTPAAAQWFANPTEQEQGIEINLEMASTGCDAPRGTARATGHRVLWSRQLTLPKARSPG
jgi:hypothetical protein